jgi:hypothetical protein
MVVSEQLKQIESTVDDGMKTTTYTCDVAVELAGDSIWDCELGAADEIRINTICVTEGLPDGDYPSYRDIGVYYTVNGFDDGPALENTWTIYTDSGFESAVSRLLGEEIYFTEQGMQEDGRASME